MHASKQRVFMYVCMYVCMYVKTLQHLNSVTKEFKSNYIPYIYFLYIFFFSILFFCDNGVTILGINFWLQSFNAVEFGNTS